MKKGIGPGEKKKKKVLEAKQNLERAQMPKSE